jgi:hypothetical protein
MDDVEVESHLSRIEPHWTAVIRAHEAPADDASKARAALLEEELDELGLLER